MPLVLNMHVFLGITAPSCTINSRQEQIDPQISAVIHEAPTCCMQPSGLMPFVKRLFLAAARAKI